MAELSRRFIEIRSLKTELYSGGAGQPLLFLHPGDGIDDCLPILRALADHFRVYAASHPGFGGTDLPRSIRTVDDIAYFYLDLLDELDLSQVILCGASLGGWIALEIATKNIARLAALVLAAPVGLKFGDRETRDIADMFSMTDPELRAALTARVSLALDPSQLSQEKAECIARNRETFQLIGWSPTLYNPKLRHRLHRIGIPTRLIWGDEDRIVGPGYGKALCAEIPNCDLRSLKGVGHYAHLDAPREFLVAVTSFADQVPGRNP